MNRVQLAIFHTNIGEVIQAYLATHAPVPPPEMGRWQGIY